MDMFTTGTCGRKRRRYCYTLSVILGLLTAAGHPAMPAAAEVSLRVSPVVIELEAKPGATGSHKLTASNEGDQPVLITAAIEPYKTASDVDRSAVDWLTVEPGSFELGPAEEQTVNVSIAVPDDVPASGRYALVTFTTGAPEAATDEGGSGIGVAGSLGAVFLFAIDGEGELNRHASLERFAPILEPDGRIGFRAEVLNDGNLYLQATGAVLVTNGADEAAGSLEFPPTTAQLQGETNVLSSFGSLPLQPDEPYRAEALLDYNGAEPMTATLEFTPAIALAVTGTALCENVDRGPTLNLRNDGTLGLLPPVQADITDANDQPIATGEPGIPALIWPGETGVVTVDFPIASLAATMRRPCASTTPRRWRMAKRFCHPWSKKSGLPSAVSARMQSRSVASDETLSQEECGRVPAEQCPSPDHGCADGGPGPDLGAGRHLAHGITGPNQRPCDAREPADRGAADPNPKPAYLRTHSDRRPADPDLHPNPAYPRTHSDRRPVNTDAYPDRTDPGHQ